MSSATDLSAPDVEMEGEVECRKNIDDEKEHPLLNLLGITEQCVTFQNHYICSVCSNKKR